MACTANKVSLLRIFASRGFSAKSAPKASEKSSDVQVTTLPNKLVVATAKSHLPIASVSIVFRAGARYEDYDQLGASHLLRISAGLSTYSTTGFAITRNLQQIGAQLYATSDRELVTYTLQTTCNNIDLGIKFLEDVATTPAFKPWEISDSVPRLNYELAAIPDSVRAVDLLHKAAFRRALGNSIFCPTHQVGRLSTETLLHYFCQTCSTNRCAVVGVGVDHNFLAGFAKNFSLSSGEGKKSTSKFYGQREIRTHKAGHVAHVAVAGEGGALGNFNEALAFAILQRAAGLVPVTKRGNNVGTFGKALKGNVGDAHVSISAINASYADTGLYGFLLTAEANAAGKAVEAGIKALKSGNISAEDIKRGKSALKASILRRQERDSGVLSDLGFQAALLGKIQIGETLASAVDAISDAEVQAAAKKVACSKLSMAAVGNLSTVPYINDFQTSK